MPGLLLDRFRKEPADATMHLMRLNFSAEEIRDFRESARAVLTFP